MADYTADSSADIKIAHLYAQLLSLGNPEWNSTTYEVLLDAIGGMTNFNLNRVFKMWSSPTKVRALATVFDLVEASSVESLDLRNNALDPDQMREAFASSKFGGRRRLIGLKSLDLSQNELGTSKGGISWLADAIQAGCLPSLVRLSLCGNSITMADMEILSNALVLLPGLQSLCLKLEDSDVGLSEERGLALCLRNGFLPNLQELRISSNRLRTSGVEALANAFKTGSVSTLKVLDLGHNDISHPGHLALAAVLEAGFLPSLEELRLKSSSLDSDAVKAYATAVKSGRLPALRVLDFSWNSIGNDAVTALADAIKAGQITALTEVNLARTSVGDEGVLALASSFESGLFLHLRELDLYATKVGDDGIARLATVLGSGHLDSLESLNVLGTLCTGKTESACVAAGSVNSHLAFLLSIDVNHVSGSWEMMRSQNQKTMSTKSAIQLCEARCFRDHGSTGSEGSEAPNTCWQFFIEKLAIYSCGIRRCPGFAWKNKKK